MRVAQRSEVVVSVPVVIVLVIVGMVSLVAVAAVVSQLLARVKRLAADLQEIERDLMPRVDRLREGTDVTGREMERLSRAVDELSERRTH